MTEIESKTCFTCMVEIKNGEEQQHKGHYIIEDKLNEDNRKELSELHEQKKAEDIVYNPNILDEIQKDLSKIHVGDNKTKVLVSVLLASSKRLGHEQAVIIKKQSSAGGSNLQNSCLNYFDDKITLTRMTGAYLDRSQKDYTGKILSVGEMSGFDSSSSSLRQKISEGKSELATTNKNEKGKIVTEILTTEGRPTFITTTASEEIDPELENRCWILSVDESSAQTKAVNKFQLSKETFEFEAWTPNTEIKALFNSGILEDLKVANPFADVISENFPSDKVTARRDSKRFSELITTISYMHQYQRIKIKTKNQTFLITSYQDLQHALYYGQEALKNTLNKIGEKEESVLAFMQAKKDQEYFTRLELVDATGIPYGTMKRILIKMADRSLVQVEEVDRVWKYKLRSSAVTHGLSLGSESDFEAAALSQLDKHANNFEEIILPPNYQTMTGPDAAIVKKLLSYSDVVTIKVAGHVRAGNVPVTTLPPVPVIGTQQIQVLMPVATNEGDSTRNSKECIKPTSNTESALIVEQVKMAQNKTTEEQ